MASKQITRHISLTRHLDRLIQAFPTRAALIFLSYRNTSARTPPLTWPTKSHVTSNPRSTKSSDLSAQGHRRSDLTGRMVLFYRVHSYLLITGREGGPCAFCGFYMLLAMFDHCLEK
jgi:hypothetical protein